MSSFYLPNIGAGFFPDNTGGGDYRVAGIRSPDTGFVYSNMPSYYLSEGGGGGGFGGGGGNAIPRSLINDMMEGAKGYQDIVDGVDFGGLGQQGFDALMAIDPMGNFNSMFDSVYGDAQAQLNEGRGRLDAAQSEARRRTDQFIGDAQSRGDEDIAQVEGRIDSSLARMEQAIDNFEDNNAATVAAMGDSYARNAQNNAMKMEQDLINQGVPPAQAKAQANEIKMQAGRDLYKTATQLYTKRDDTLAKLGTQAASMGMQGANLAASTRLGVSGQINALRQAAIQQDTTLAGQVANFEQSSLQSMNSLRQAGIYGTNQAMQQKVNLTKYAYDFQLQAQELAVANAMKAQSMMMQGFGDVANLHLSNYSMGMYG